MRVYWGFVFGFFYSFGTFGLVLFFFFGDFVYLFGLGVCLFVFLLVSFFGWLVGCFVTQVDICS